MYDVGITSIRITMDGISAKFKIDVDNVAGNTNKKYTEDLFLFYPYQQFCYKKHINKL